MCGIQSMRVFVSFGHKDENLFKEVVEHLNAAGRAITDIAVWEDSLLQPGEHRD